MAGSVYLLAFLFSVAERTDAGVVVKSPASAVTAASRSHPWVSKGIFLAGPGGEFNGSTLGRWARYRKDRILFDDGLTVQFLGSSASATIEGDELSESSIFLISGPQSGSSAIPSYSSIRYRNVYPGIDLACRITGEGWKTDFILAPGSKASAIRLKYSGAKHLSIGSGGELRIAMANRDLIEERIPATYQIDRNNGQRIPLRAAYRMNADGTVGFSLDEDEGDPGFTTVIDPSLQFSSYWGGNGAEAITAVAFGADDSVFIAGWTLSTNLPAVNSAQNANRGATDGFVAKVSRTGQSLIWATFFGGSGDERILSMAVDPSGKPVITGWTSSGNFPLQSPIKSILGGPSDAFVARIASIGSYMEFSTYFGGSGADAFNAVTLDSTGIYLGGQTSSSDFPVQGAVQYARGGGVDGTLVKLDPNGYSTLFSSYYGGTLDDSVNTVAVCQQQLFAGGGTLSANLPVVSGSGPKGGMDGFLVRLNSQGNTVVGSTYVGGSLGGALAPEMVSALQVTSKCEAVAGGVTVSPDFSALNAAQTVFAAGGSDGFLAKYSSTSFSTIQWRTFLGGSGADAVQAIAIRPSGQVVSVGSTTSPDFPVLNATQAGHAGQYDAFVTVYSTAGVPVFSTLLGGSGSDSAGSVATGKMDGDLLLIGGSTGSLNLPILAPLQSTADAVTQNGFFSELKMSGGMIHQRDKAGYFRQGGFALDLNGDFAWNSGDTAFSFGMPTDIPVAGDWTGTGQLRVGVFRGGVWYVDIDGDRNWTWGVDQYYYYGIPGDIPVVGDWNGDGRSKIGVYRPSTGTWYLDYDANHCWTNYLDKIIKWGAPDDLPVVGDWNGSGPSKIGLFKTGRRTVDLAWNDTVNPVGTVYSVFRATGSCSGSPVFSRIANAITGLKYSDKALNPGTYCYAVTALYGGTESILSTTAAANFAAPSVNWFLDTDGDFIFTSGVDTELLLGVLGDIPAPMSLDMVRTEPVIFRPTTGAWIAASGLLGYFGYPGDYPIVAPW